MGAAAAGVATPDPPPSQSLGKDVQDIFAFGKLLFVGNHPHVDDDGDHKLHEKSDNNCCISGHETHSRLGSDPLAGKTNPGAHELKSTRLVAVTL